MRLSAYLLTYKINVLQCIWLHL